MGKVQNDGGTCTITMCLASNAFNTCILPQVCEFDSSITDLHCCPAGVKKQQGSTELFAAACADGKAVIYVPCWRAPRQA